jgi:hypothetical protein
LLVQSEKYKVSTSKKEEITAKLNENVKGNSHNSIQFFIIYVPSQQLQANNNNNNNNNGPRDSAVVEALCYNVVTTLKADHAIIYLRTQHCNPLAHSNGIVVFRSIAMSKFIELEVCVMEM